ncbi:hypothetical protein DIE22_14500 [Burkholderia sp. Bp9142]|nr:hypothetical protein DIE22_14500 [Burkholderia sp. Bp9142]
MSAHPAKVALATSATSIAIVFVFVFFIGFPLSRPGVLPAPPACYRTQCAANAQHRRIACGMRAPAPIQNL